MIGIVTPTYNEAGNIPTLIEGLKPLGAQLIVVDDGSTDGTASIAEEAGAIVIRRGSKLGLASERAGTFPETAPPAKLDILHVLKMCSAGPQPRGAQGEVLPAQAPVPLCTTKWAQVVLAIPLPCT